eukprot:UN10992
MIEYNFCAVLTLFDLNLNVLQSKENLIFDILLVHDAHFQKKRVCLRASLILKTL